MSFNEFIETVKGIIESRLKDNEYIDVQEVMKNNNLVLTGICIKRKDNNIAPTIYLESYYNDYVEGKHSLEWIVDNILNVYRENTVEVPYEINDFLEFDKIKDKIIFKMINYKMNQKLLEDTPYILVNDLAMIFQVLVCINDGGNATITIKKEHNKIWEKTANDLMEFALVNTPKLLPPSIHSMSEILSEFAGTDIPGPVDMWVLSNQGNINGASVIMYENLLNDLADVIERNLYLIPSSIHEWIVIPDDGIEVEELRLMVKDVNDTQLIQEDILSYNIYYFDNKTEEFIIK